MSGQDGEVGPFPELTDCGLQRSGSHFFEMFGIATVSGALKMKAPQGKHHKSRFRFVLHTFGFVCFTLSLHSDVRLLSMSPFIQSKVQMRDFPGGPVVKTRSFHCRGHGCYPWSGN